MGPEEDADRLALQRLQDMAEQAAAVVRNGKQSSALEIEAAEVAISIAQARLAEATAELKLWEAEALRLNNPLPRDYIATKVEVAQDLVEACRQGVALHEKLYELCQKKAEVVLGTNGGFLQQLVESVGAATGPMATSPVSASHPPSPAPEPRGTANTVRGSARPQQRRE